MTDATGTCFVSYRRSRGSDVGLIVGALRDRGVPVYQDISDLGSALTEQELRRVLYDSSTAAAVLYVTPEVEGSVVIRDVEAPIIIERHLRADGFAAIVVAAGGLDYGDVGRVLGSGMGPAHMPAWNVYKVGSSPLLEDDASRIADVALEHRLAAVNQQLSGGEALKVIVSTRAPVMKRSGWALAADLTHRFEGRVARPGAWETHILPGFRAIREAIQKKAAGRQIECAGQISLAAAVALGAEFLSVSGLRAAWVQDLTTFGGGQEVWSLQGHQEETSFVAETYPGDLACKDVAMTVSVTHNIMDDFQRSFHGKYPFRALVHVYRRGEFSERSRISAGEAVRIAHLSVDGLREALANYKTRGCVHVFLAAPAGLAFLVGQLLNSCGEIQTYEHLPGRDPCYVRAAILHPSN